MAIYIWQLRIKWTLVAFAHSFRMTVNPSTLCAHNGHSKRCDFDEDFCLLLQFIRRMYQTKKWRSRSREWIIVKGYPASQWSTIHVWIPNNRANSIQTKKLHFSFHPCLLPHWYSTKSASIYISTRFRFSQNVNSKLNFRSTFICDDFSIVVVLAVAAVLLLMMLACYSLSFDYWSLSFQLGKFRS